MADERPDESQKTEDPTQKRLQEAQQKGQVAKSQEVGHWFMIMAFAIMVGFLAPGVARELGDALYGFIARPHAIRVDGAGIQSLLGELASNLGLALSTLVLLAMVAALASGVLQTGFILTTEPIKPKLERISPLSGLKRLFSARARSSS